MATKRKNIAEPRNEREAVRLSCRLEKLTKDRMYQLAKRDGLDVPRTKECIEAAANACEWLIKMRFARQEPAPIVAR